MQLITSLAVLAAAVNTASAAKAIIQNNCGFDTYAWPVDAQRNPSSPTVIKAGGQWSEDYHTPTSGGVSIKLSLTTDRSSGKISQLEYTLAGGFIWYDGSNVDCRGANCPFYAHGAYLDTSDSSCPTRTCPIGQDCTGFYINYNDDVNSLSCNPKADVRLYLCGTQAAAAGAASAKAVDSAPAAAAPAAAAPSAPAAAPSAAAPAVAAPAASSPAAPAAASSDAAPSPKESKSPKKYQMEAVEKYTPPTTLQTKFLQARSTPQARHAHHRRHGH